MHKFFAKTSFLGKKIISLPECHSTNDFLISMAKSEPVERGTIVQTEFQTQGRGQVGNKWEDSPGENLIFSFFIKEMEIPISQQYIFNLISSISIVKALDKYLKEGDKLEVKWPNDIYLNDMKLAGILIESSVLGRSMEWVVVGVGLNVNQRFFTYSNATSLLKEKLNVDKWTLLEDFCLEFERCMVLQTADITSILTEYHDRLRWYQETHFFESISLGAFLGRILGIDEVGRLKIETNNVVHSFDVKEVKFLN